MPFFVLKIFKKENEGDIFAPRFQIGFKGSLDYKSYDQISPIKNIK